MMTLYEYDREIEKYTDKMNEDNFDDIYERLSEFQDDYMKGVLADYASKIDCPAREYIFELFEYAVDQSQSGNSIIWVPDEATANQIEDIIWEDIGDYLLDYEIYEQGNEWVVDAMFAGNYVPFWDGWREG